jgi:hypothetical protein
MLHRLTDNKEICLKLIKKENILLQDFEECCLDLVQKNKEFVKEIWNAFLEEDKVIPCWENVLVYWKNYGFTSIMDSFLSKYMSQLCYGEEYILSEQFISDLIIREISSEAFETFILSYRLEMFDISLEMFDQEKISILIRHKYFEITPEYSEQMKNNFPELWTEFIILNKKTVLSKWKEYTMTDIQIRQLIESDGLDDEEKVFLIDEMSDGIDINVAQIIYVLSCPVKKEIWDAAWKFFDKEQKIEVLTKQFNLYTLDELEQKVTELGGKYADLADRTRRHDVKLSMSDMNYKFSEVLQKKGYLSSVTIGSEKIQDNITYENKVEKFIVCRVRKKN